MLNFRALVHYRFKQGKEEQGLQFLEKELIKNAQDYGCHDIEILQNGKDATNVIGIALWDSLEDARRFQSDWEAKEKELLKLCVEDPHREFFKIRTTYVEKGRKAA